MRFIAIILSILVIKLSVLPCCLDSNSNETVQVTEACCQQTNTSSTEDDSDQEKKACSPFFSCCASAGFVFMRPAMKLDNQKLQEVKTTFAYLNNYSFMWDGSIFQPPQHKA